MSDRQRKALCCVCGSNPKKIDLRTVESLIGALDAARDAVGTVKTEGIAQ